MSDQKVIGELLDGLREGLPLEGLGDVMSLMAEHGCLRLRLGELCIDLSDRALQRAEASPVAREERVARTRTPSQALQDQMLRSSRDGEGIG